MFVVFRIGRISPLATDASTPSLRRLHLRRIVVVRDNDINIFCSACGAVAIVRAVTAAGDFVVDVCVALFRHRIIIVVWNGVLAVDDLSNGRCVSKREYRGVRRWSKPGNSDSEFSQGGLQAQVDK